MNTNIDNLHNFYTLEKIYNEIIVYNNERIYIGNLIYNLERLSNSLLNIDKEWKKKFRQHWTSIEIIYALSLDTTSQTLTQEDKNEINLALEEIKKLVIKKLLEIEDEISFFNQDSLQNSSNSGVA